MKMTKLKIFLSSIILIISALLSAKDVWVDIKFSKQFNTEISPNQAKIKTLNEARKKAIEKGAVKNISISTFIKDYYQNKQNQIEEETAINTFMHTTAGAIIIEEEIYQNKIIAFNENSFTINFKGRFLIKDKELKLLDDFHIKTNKYTYLENENIVLELSPLKDGFFYIFYIDALDNIQLICPNEYYKENQAKAQNTFILPNEDNRYSLKANLYPNFDEAFETFFIIFSEKKLILPSLKKNLSTEPLLKTAENSYYIFQKWFSKLDYQSISFKSFQIHILKR